MSTPETAGVTALATILSAIPARDDWTAASLAKAHALPRSSTYEIVRKLVDAGFLRRGLGGRLAIGPMAIRLGYAGYCVAPLAGAAEAALGWLRQQTGARVALIAENGDVIQALPAGTGRTGADLSLPLRPPDGAPRAELVVHFRRDAGGAERHWTTHCARRVLLSLEKRFADEGDRE